MPARHHFAMIIVAFRAAFLMLCCNAVYAAAGPAVLHQSDMQRLIRVQASEMLGCTRLLNADGQVGCSVDKTEAVLLALDTPDQPLSNAATVVLSALHLNAFLLNTKSNATLQQLIIGILVDPTDIPQQDSPAAKFPLAAYAPYSQPSFAWNPPGTGLALEEFTFPILLLDNKTAPQAADKAAYNAQHGYKGALHNAHLEALMSASGNASTCIKQQTCQPLGGHSIWAAAPPLPPTANSSSSQLPIIMLLAPVDSDSLFRSATVGADSAMGSLITLLAVADILGNNTAAVATYSKRLVLTALMGEPWGFMGSKRLLWEMHNDADTTTGLNLDVIEQVLEIGQVGRAGLPDEQQFSFYAHSQQAPAFGDPTTLLEALQQASQQTTEVKVDVQPAAASNPGIPPSSLSSFLRVKPSLPGVVLAEHQGPFTNPFYQSRFDTVDNIQSASLAAAAVVLARALHGLAAGRGTPQLKVDGVAVQATVTQLIDCLLRDTPGLQCLMGQRFLGSQNADTAEHYISVLRTLTKDSQEPLAGVKSSLELFIWNFLALSLSHALASDTVAEAACDFSKNQCRAGAVCAEYVPGQESGHCVKATVKFVPAYSTRMECKDCDASNSFQWQESRAAAGWEQLHGWPPDPMWTESNWPPGQPSLQIFQKESKAAATAALAAGVIAALGSLCALLGPQMMYNYLQQGTMS
ncbi:TPA: hypothetical protein ACH3X1_016125 [Trebouxia sp. C0004]